MRPSLYTFDKRLFGKFQVSNSIGQCHCDIGYAPPNCSFSGNGGSYHSNPIFLMTATAKTGMSTQPTSTTRSSLATILSSTSCFDCWNKSTVPELTADAEFATTSSVNSSEPIAPAGVDLILVACIVAPLTVFFATVAMTAAVVSYRRKGTCQ